MFEILSVKEDFHPLIVDRAPLSRLRQNFRKAGMRSLSDAMLEKVMTGETTISEYHRVVDVYE